jgi:hypothetical protein
MNYFLTLQIGVYEMGHGKIPIPSSVMPGAPDAPPSDVQAADPSSKAIFEYISKIREEFFGR